MNKAGIFKEQRCPDAGTLLKYSKGELERSLSHDVEHHLLTCSLCNAALDGMPLLVSVDGLDKVKKSNPFAKKNNGWFWGGAGAVIVGVSSLLFFYSDDVVHEITYEEHISPVVTDTVITDADSVPAQDTITTTQTVIAYYDSDTASYPGEAFTLSENVTEVPGNDAKALPDTNPISVNPEASQFLTQQLTQWNSQIGRTVIVPERLKLRRRIL
jgi:hypothetical protein